MYQACVTLVRPARRSERKQLELVLANLAEAWWRGGQSLSEAVAWTAVDAHTIVGDVGVLERRSLAREFASPSARYEVERVAELTGARPRVTIVGRVLGATEADRCRSPRAYVMFTHAYSNVPAIRCGGCLAPVPLYRLPGSRTFRVAGDRDWQVAALQSWQRAFRWYDEMWFASGVGERYAFRELSRLGSELNKDGMSSREFFEVRLGRPVYYFLWASTLGGDSLPDERPCPGCGGEWFTKREVFTKFRHRCDRCRLVSM